MTEGKNRIRQFEVCGSVRRAATSVPATTLHKPTLKRTLSNARFAWLRLFASQHAPVSLAFRMPTQASQG